MNETTADHGRQQAPTLARALGPRIAIAVVVGNVIGSGIYLKPGTIAASGLSFPLIMLVWVVGGALCVLGALCFAELAAMLPHAGGMYVYLREAYGRPVAFLFGWTDFIVRLPGSIAALAVAFVGYLFLALGWEPQSDVPKVLTCVAAIAVFAWVNILGVLWGGRLQMVFTVIKVSTLALFAASPLLLAPFVPSGEPLGGAAAVAAANETAPSAEAPSDEAPSAEADAGPPSSLWTQIGIVLLAIMWAYNGWHGITPLAEEVQDPHRNIPWALLGGIGILIALYLSANFAFHHVLSMDEMAAAKKDAAARMLEKLIGQTGVVVMTGIVMCSTFGAINTNLLQAPRIPFAMGRDGTFFRDLGRVHASYRTPAMAIFISAVAAMLFIVLGAVAQWLARDVDPQQYQWQFTQKVLTSLKKGELFDLLTDFVIFAASIFYTLTAAAVIVLRFRRPDLPRPYKTQGFPIVPLLFVAVYIWFLSQVYVDKPLEANAGLILIAVGVPVYFAYQALSRRPA